MSTALKARPHAPPRERIERAAVPGGKGALRPDRRLAILLSAEKLFSERGYHGVSIRHIAEDAGVPLALVGYYFGTKPGLFRAIFERWSATIDERLARLREAERQPWDAGRLERIIEAFVMPVIAMRASPEGEYYALLMTQGVSPPIEEVSQVICDFFDPMAQAFIEALHSTLAHEAPTITRASVAWCYQFALGTLLHHIADTRVQTLSQHSTRANDASAAPLLVAFIVHGIRGTVARLHPPISPSKPRTRRPT